MLEDVWELIQGALSNVFEEGKRRQGILLRRVMELYDYGSSGDVVGWEREGQRFSSLIS